MLGRLVCNSCYKHIARDQEYKSQQLSTLLKKIVRDSWVEFLSHLGQPEAKSDEQSVCLAPAQDQTMQPSLSRGLSNPSEVIPAQRNERADSSGPEVQPDLQAEGEDTASSVAEDLECSGFEFALVQPFIKAVKAALE